MILEFRISQKLFIFLNETFIFLSRDQADVLDKIYELERNSEALRQSESQLHDLEVQLRMKYPRDAPLVLDKVIYQVVMVGDFGGLIAKNEPS